MRNVVWTKAWPNEAVILKKVTCGWLKFWKGDKERKWKKKRHENMSREEGALSQKTWIKVRTYPPAPTQHLRPCSAIVILTSNMSARSFFKFSVSKWKNHNNDTYKSIGQYNQPFFYIVTHFLWLLCPGKVLVITFKWRRVNISKIIMFKRSSQSGF